MAANSTDNEQCKVRKKKRCFVEMINETHDGNESNNKSENTNNSTDKISPPRRKRQCNRNNKEKDDENDKDKNDGATVSEEEKKAMIIVSDQDIQMSIKLKKQASDHLNNKDLTNAEKEYLNALKYDPNDATIYVKLSEIYYQTSSYHKALIAAYKSVRADPSNQCCWIYYGLSWMKLKNYKFAGIAFNTAETLKTDKKNQDDIKYDDGYTAKQEEIDKFVNGFNDRYKNLEQEMDQLFKSLLDNNEDLRNMYFKHNKVTEELGEAMNKHSEMTQFITAQDIFELIIESKYKSLDYINTLKQKRNCWNLTVEPLGRYKVQKSDLDKIVDNEEIKDPMRIKHDGSIFDFDKLVFRIQISNSTNGTVAWVNRGHHGMNESVWTDLNEHIIFGEPTAIQVVNIIKRVILCHRLGVRGDCVSEKPKYIVLSSFLQDEYQDIKAKLEKINIECYLSNQVPQVMSFGPFDGNVLLM